MAYWQKTVYLDLMQAALVYEILDRVCAQTALPSGKEKSALGAIYMEDYVLTLPRYNLLVGLYDDLLANKNIVYEESGTLHYVNSSATPDGKKDLGLDERQLELLTEFVKTFLSQNNGVGVCKLDLSPMEIDYPDYRKLRAILSVLAPNA